MDSRLVLTLLLGGALHAVLAGVLYSIVTPSAPARSIPPIHDVSEKEAVVVLRCRPDPHVNNSRKRVYDGPGSGAKRKYARALDRFRPSSTQDLECLVIGARR